MTRLILVLGDQLTDSIAALDAADKARDVVVMRSEEHTSELQSLTNLVCRLLLEKKTTTINSQ